MEIAKLLRDSLAKVADDEVSAELDDAACDWLMAMADARQAADVEGAALLIHEGEALAVRLAQAPGYFPTSALIAGIVCGARGERLGVSGG